MNRINNGRLIVVAAISAMALSSVAAFAADQAVYGRAGGTVGAERVQQLAAVRADDKARADIAVNWFGRAGGPVGVDRVAGVNKSKAYAAGESKLPVVYGRAGVPLPFGG